MELALQRYAELELQKRAIEDEQAKLKEAALGVMHENGTKTLVSPFGSFKVSVRKKWTYTPEVTKAEGVYKALKKAEEETGLATAVESESVSFYPATE